MQEYLPIIIGAYFAVISLIAIIMTMHDKRAAQKGKRRVAEKTLILISVLGGSAAMLLTMLYIRHKTKHAAFMVGIPVIIALQAAAVVLVWWKFCNGNIL